MNWLSGDIPSSWANLLVGAIKIAVVAFIVLQMKEWFDAGSFDTPATATDAVLVAGGTFILNAFLKLAKL
jgi:hypothetical protein